LYVNNQAVSSSENKKKIYFGLFATLILGVGFLMWVLHDPSYQTLISEGVFDVSKMAELSKSPVLIFGLILFYSHTIFHYLADRVLFKYNSPNDSWQIKESLL
jgi:heme/copper-type cytochrome/quinol oxidase subunit 3